MDLHVGGTAPASSAPIHARDTAAHPLRIGILTFHRCINYGSYWQARCLVEGLRARGHDAVLLDHHAREVTWKEWRCALDPLLPHRSPRADRRDYAAKARRFFAAFDALPLSSPFPLHDPAGTDGYDLIVVGSDEVWNLSHPWYGGRALFYGDGVRSGRLVSYAASFGNHDAEAGLDDRWAGLLRGFDTVSVRDENSRRLVRAALGRDPAMVLDPCLQFPPAAPSAHDLPRSPYAVVYGHGLPDWFAAAARAWATTRGVRLVSIGYRNDFADEQRLTDGPEAFAALIAGAEAVVTNFFHGCVFALVNARPFACAATPYRRNKLRDLTRIVGADAHLLDDTAPPEALAALLDQPLDPAIATTIRRLRETSDAFLDHVLA